MTSIEIAAYFFAGVFTANSIPHIVNGISGRKFPEKSPFKKNHQNESSFETFFFSPIVNVIWGMCNMTIGFVIVNCVGTFSFGLTSNMLIFSIGFFATAIFLAWNIGKVHYKRNKV